jgi:cytochrome c oxidase subunit II
MESFDPVTRQGLAITNLFGLELAISGVLLAIVAVWLGMAVLRFRARPGEATEPTQVHGNRRLEVIWTLTPAAILVVVFFLVIETMRSVNASAADAQPLRVVGHQWWWEFEYPNLQVTTANELHVPVGAPLQVSLQSIDVIHSFHVPQFGWMRDAIPGKTNQMSIFVDRQGMFAGTCNQYCGLQHAWMRIVVVAEPADQFSTWVRQQQQSVTPSGVRGEQVFLQNTCVNCHTIRGVSAQGNLGPDLTHVGSRTTLGSGVIDNTADNLGRWLRNPSSIKPGVLMPAYQSLSAADLTALVDYLESLK